MSIIASKVKQWLPKLSLSVPPFEILLLEGSPDDAFQITRILNQIGRVFWEQSIERGLELAERKNFDIVLLDLSIENKFGLDAFTHFYDNRPDIPILILSDFEGLLLAESVLDKGALGIIKKSKLSQGDYLIKMVTGALIKAKFIKKTEKLLSKSQKEDYERTRPT